MHLVIKASSPQRLGVHRYGSSAISGSVAFLQVIRQVVMLDVG